MAALEAERTTLTARIQALDEAGLSAQPETDPEARVMKGGRVGYNLQSTVDSKHRLISDVDVVQDRNDLQQLYRMDGGRFLLRGLQKVKAEMALAVTAYNLTRAINVLGVRPLCQALTARVRIQKGRFNRSGLWVFTQSLRRVFCLNPDRFSLGGLT